MVKQMSVINSDGYILYTKKVITCYMKMIISLFNDWMAIQLFNNPTYI